jgi:molybdopterin-guanine dinucleotide biosynthesis protein A
MLSGLILAGGLSSRMGRDKAALTLPDGRTWLQRQADILRAAGVGSLLVSVRAGSGMSLPGATVVTDTRPDAGPLAGIAAGLRAAPTGLVILLAVDMPSIQGAHLRELLEWATPECGVVPLQGGQLEPLAAVYPTALAASAEAALKAGKLAVHAWARQEAAQGRLLLWETPAAWAGVLRSWNAAGDLPPPSSG